MDVVSAVVARLREGDTPWRDVKGLMALSDLDNKLSNRLPVLFVLMLKEQAQPDIRGSGPLLQSVRLTLGVVTIVRSVNGTEPDLLPMRQQIRQRLFGWQPAGFEALALAGGQLLNVISGQVAWIDQFTTEYTEDANHGP